MNQTVKLVRDYYNSGFQKRKLDTDLLTTCVENLPPEDVAYIQHNGSMTLHSCDEQYRFFMEKLLIRYEDIVAGRTRVDQDGCITFTTSSSVMELCNDAETYAACKRCGINRIKDVDPEHVRGLSMVDTGALLASLLVYQVND